MGRAVAVPPFIWFQICTLLSPHSHTTSFTMPVWQKSLLVSTQEPLVLCTQIQIHTSPLSKSNRDCRRRGCFHTQRNGITREWALHPYLFSSQGSCQKLKQGLTQKQAVSLDNPYFLGETLWRARETMLRTSQSAAWVSWDTKVNHTGFKVQIATFVLVAVGLQRSYQRFIVSW